MSTAPYIGTSIAGQITIIAIGVVFQGRFLRFNENFAAGGALFPRRFSRFCAGRFYRRDDLFRVRFERRFLLSNYGFLADRAILTLGQAVGEAGRLNSLESSVGMRCEGYLLLEHEDRVAAETNLAVGKPLFLAGCYLACYLFRIAMQAESLVIADVTGRVVVTVVSVRGKRRLRRLNEHLTAGGTHHTSRATVLHTGGFYVGHRRR